MPLLSGAVACRRYRVMEPPPEGYLAPYGKALVKNAFRPVDDAKGETQSSGWVTLRNILEQNFAPGEWHHAPYALLGFRVDKKSVPVKLLRAKLELVIREKLRATKREKLSREEKASMELAIKAEMLKGQEPNVSVTEVAWNLETGRVIVGSTATGVNDLITGAFAETFGLTAVPQFPYLLAEEWAERKKRVRFLHAAGPDDFGAAYRRRIRGEEIGPQVVEFLEAEAN
jgi:recombination associated protein RdgC